MLEGLEPRSHMEPRGPSPFITHQLITDEFLPTSDIPRSEVEEQDVSPLPGPVRSRPYHVVPDSRPSSDIQGGRSCTSWIVVRKG